MATQDLHEVLFEWPHPEPTTVIVTGTFDEWSCSVPLTKTPTGFVGSTRISWGEKIKFKYVVDGQWVLHEDQVTETDPGGFVNHVYTAPPAPPATEAPPAAPPTEPVVQSAAIEETPATDTPAENVPEVVADSSEQAAEVVPETEKLTDSEQAPNASSTGLPQLLSDIADTIAARDGTSSALGYVSSGLGAAIHNVVGIDPINTQQIAIPTPATDAAFVLPDEQEPASNNAALPIEPSQDAAKASAEEPFPSPIAPIVPLLIVPVNAAENNTAATSETIGEVATAPFIPGPIVRTSAPLEVVAEPTTAEGTSEAVVDAVVEEPAVSEVEGVEPIVVTGEEATSSAPESDPTDAASPPTIEEPTHLPETVVDTPAAATVVDEPMPSEPIAEAGEIIAEVKVDEAAVPEPIAVVEEVVVLPAEEQKLEPPVITDDVAVEPKSDAPLSTVEDTAADPEKPQEELTVFTPEEPVGDEESPIAAPVPAETVKEVEDPVHSVPEPEAPVPLAEAVAAASSNEIPVVETAAEAVPVVEVEEEKNSTKPATAIPSGAEAIVLPETSIVDSVHTSVPESDAAPETTVAEDTSALIQVPQISSPEEVAESTVADSTPAEVPQASSQEAPVVENVPSAIEETATETPVPLMPVEEQTKLLAEEPKQNIQPEALDLPQAPPNGHDVASTANISATNGHSSTVTPTGTTTKAFPSATDSPTISADNSPSSSKVNTMRKKRTSILGKIKHIFQHDKDKK